MVLKYSQLVTQVQCSVIAISSFCCSVTSFEPRRNDIWLDVWQFMYVHGLFLEMHFGIHNHFLLVFWFLKISDKYKSTVSLEEARQSMTCR